jgi:hypothetical protein
MLAITVAIGEEMTALSPTERQGAWAEMAQDLQQFEVPDGFADPAIRPVGVGTK